MASMANQSSILFCVSENSANAIQFCAASWQFPAALSTDAALELPL